MPQQFPDDRQPKTAASTKAGEGVPQIVQADADQSCTLGHGVPWPLKVSARQFRIIARDHERPNLLESSYHREGRSVEDDSLATALAVGQEQQASFQIDVLPAQVQDFPQTAAGEEQ